MGFRGPFVGVMYELTAFYCGVSDLLPASARPSAMQYPIILAPAIIKADI